MYFEKEASAKAAYEHLLEKYGILGVDGSSYGEEDRVCVRFSFASSMITLEQTIERLKNYEI